MNADPERAAIWRAMPDAERAALSPAERKAHIENYRKHTSYIDGAADRLGRAHKMNDTQIALAKNNGARFPRVWIDDAIADTIADYLAKGIINRKQLCVIYGPAGDGKTFFTADLAGHIAAGISWRGRRVRQGLVVYIAAEAGTSILRRFFAWRDHHLSEAREGRTPLAIITRGVNLLNMVNVEELLGELRAIAAEGELPLALVIFDTLSRSIPGGDENRSEDMTRVIEAADLIRDELGAATAIVHHSGKDKDKGARGHSSLFAAADTVISVVDRVATVEKSRDGVAGEQFPFNLEVVNLGEDQDGDPVTTCIVTPTDAAPRQPGAAKLSGVARIALQSLREAIADHGQTMPGTSTIPGNIRAVRIEQWRVQFRLRYGTDDDGGERDVETIKKAFQRGREALHKEQAIGISNPYAWALR